VRPWIFTQVNYPTGEAFSTRRIKPKMPPKELKMATNLRREEEPGPRFVVYLCDMNDDPCQRLAEYNTIADVLARKRRFDQVVKVSVGRQLLEWPEFVEWAKAQEDGTAKD
jgi:hypothetical protein